MSSETSTSQCFDLAVLVVLYKCKASASQTLATLLDSSRAQTGMRVRLIIWNNGPHPDVEIEEFATMFGSTPCFDASCVETISNTPLSEAYNRFIESCDAATYAIFDHDSSVNLRYLRLLAQGGYGDIAVPRIVVGESVHGPLLDGAPVLQDATTTLSSGTNFTSIGSGLALRKSAVSRFNAKFQNVFDEHYALYGVDTTFWLRARKLSIDTPLVVTCAHELEHSLSRLENEDRVVVSARRTERGLDIGITLRRYLSAFWLAKLAKVVVKRPFLGRFPPSSAPSIRWIVRGYISGRHPRCGAS